jgi:hypothetical protein
VGLDKFDARNVAGPPGSFSCAVSVPKCASGAIVRLFLGVALAVPIDGADACAHVGREPPEAVVAVPVFQSIRVDTPLPLSVRVACLSSVKETLSNQTLKSPPKRDVSGVRDVYDAARVTRPAQCFDSQLQGRPNAPPPDAFENRPFDSAQSPAHLARPQVMCCSIFHNETSCNTYLSRPHHTLPPPAAATLRGTLYRPANGGRCPRHPQ